MSSVLFHHVLLAVDKRLEGLTNRFSSGNTRIDFGDVVTGMLILGGALAAFWILSLVLASQERNRPCNSPLKLFLSLCKAHELPWSRRWLLWRAARYQRLRDPARLFLEPERLEAVNLSPVLRAHGAAFKEVQGRLFARSPRNARK